MRTTGCGDHDVSPALERAHLLPHRSATVDGDNVDAGAARILVNGFRDLHRQFARGDEDQPARAPALTGGQRTIAAASAVRSGGLSGAGRRLRQQIASGKEQRNGLALHWRWLLVTECRHRRHE